MTVILAILMFLTIIYTFDSILSRKYDNKYTCSSISGKPGSGKTMLLTYYAYKHRKKKWTVYADFPCNIPGVKPFSDEDFKDGKWLPDGRKNNEDILLLVDEIGTLFNNRDFKTNFKNPDVLRFWKEHRHRRVKIIYANQSWKGVDLKIKELTDIYSIVDRAFLRCWTVNKIISVKVDVVNNTSGDSNGGNIVDLYKYKPIISWKFLFIPRWVKKFNSYA